MKNSTTRFVGLDAHKATITVAVCEQEAAPVVFGTIANEEGAIRKLITQFRRSGKLIAAYEAGPTGYALYRQLTALGVTSFVVAPSLVPRRVGDRVKTDRRDAMSLARLLRSGDLTPVWIPQEEDEAFRDLVRARYDAKADLQRARNRLSKFLLWRGITPPIGTELRSATFVAWLKHVQVQHRPAQLVFADYVHTLHEAIERLRHLERELKSCAGEARQAALIAALQALRGIGLLSAATIAAETGDLRRFARARGFMAYTGLTSAEQSSGPRQHRGRITRTGNPYLRHVLVQAAHNARYVPSRSPELKQRQAGLPTDLVELAWRAQRRLHHRYCHLSGRLGRPKAVTAVARELAGFVWAIGQRMPVDGTAA